MYNLLIYQETFKLCLLIDLVLSLLIRLGIEDTSTSVAIERP